MDLNSKRMSVKQSTKEKAQDFPKIGEQKPCCGGCTTF
jgi:hypothetical protein